MKRKERFLLLLATLLIGITQALGQTIQVRGVVLDEKDAPIIGATVRLKDNASVGTATSLSGEFIIEAKEGEALLVSFVGYQTVEVYAQPQMQVKLRPESELLEEVVIVGYMPRKVASTSASVVKVGSKDIAQKPTANVLDAAQGKVSGLQIYSSSGEPSENASIKLHGNGTLNSDANAGAPLYIVDGMPVSADAIRSMNANDFESIQFLKDAAATSIYGARAANGVIYIITKKGKVGERASITFRGQYGISTLANPSYFSLDNLMSADELIAYKVKTGLMKQDDVEQFKKANPYNTNWYKYYYQPAPLYQADLSISGGAGRTAYYISGSYFNQKGMRAGSGYWKGNLRVNLNSTLNKYVKIGLNTSLSYDEVKKSPFAGNNTSGGGIAVLAPPYFSPYKDGKKGEEYYDTKIPGWNRFSPKYIVDMQPEHEKNLFANTAGHITITPLKGLTLRSQASVDFRDYTYYFVSHPSYPERNPKKNKVAHREFDRTIVFTNTNTAAYNFRLGDDHDFTLLAGHEYIDSDYSWFKALGKGLDDDRLTMLKHTTTEKEVDEKWEEFAFLSFFGQLSYGFMDRYFLDATIRRDSSSRFGPNKRSGTFWSAGLLWKAKQEAFLKDVTWLDALDVRISTGTQGNAEVGNYNAYATTGKIGQYQGRTGWGLDKPGNPNLGWEKQSKTTVGISASLFDRVSFNIEFYNRVTSDMLMDVPQPYSTGLAMDRMKFATIKANVGKYQNRGVDVRLDLAILKGHDYGLNFFSTFNYNKDKVLELFQGRDSWVLPGYGYGFIVGEPVVFVQPILKGVNPSNGDLEWYLPGDDIAVKQTDDSKVTNEYSDALEQNTGIPLYTPMTGGFGLSGNYKGFYAQADFAFALGKHMISNDRFFFENHLFISQGLNGTKSVGDQWQKPGDRTEFPSLNFIKANGGVQTFFDSKMVDDASFMRLKNLTIGYMLPKKILDQQEVVKGWRIYLTGRNLLTFTGYQGLDPEVDSNLSFGANPNTMQFVIGTEITF